MQSQTAYFYLFTSQFLFHFISEVGFFKILFSCILSKTCYAVRNRTACFPTRYTVIVLKYATPHTDMIYSHQASIMFVHSKQEGNIFPFFSPFCFTKSRQAVHA